MAKKANKSETDAVDLEALEEALSIDFGAAATDGDEDPDFSELEAKISEVTNDLRAASSNDETALKAAAEKADALPSERISVIAADSATDVPDTPPQAANDEVNSDLAALIYSIQQKPSSRIYLYTFIASVLWIGLCALYGYNYVLPGVDSGNVLALLSDPNTLLLAAITFIPLLPAWSFAALIRRAHDMRHAAHSMTEAAVRLLQPENVASDSISTVGKAVRREVAAIGDGVERAIARAGELEFMVQKEVMSIERSYDDSELRLRRLINEISTEREEIIGHAEKLRETITGTHTGLTSELELAGSRVEDSSRIATDKMLEKLDEKNQDITASLSSAGESLVSLVSKTADDLDARINTGKTEFETSINLAGSFMADVLETGGVTFEKHGEKVARQIEDNLSIRASEFGNRVTEAGEAMHAALDGKLGEIDESLNVKGNNLVGALGMRMEALDKVLQDRTENIGDTIAERLSGFGHSLTGHVDEAVSKLQGQTDILRENTKSVEEIITKRTQKVEDAIKEGTINFAKSVDENLKSAGTLIDDKAEQLSKLLSERASSINASLGQSLADTQRGLEEKTAELNTLLSQRANELSGIIENDAKPVIASLESTGLAINEKFGAISQTLADDAVSLFVKLGESTTLLEGMIEKAGTSLGSLGKILPQQTLDFAKSVSQSKSDMDATAELAKQIQEQFQANSSGLVKDMHRIAERFAHQGTALQEATKLIDSAQGNLGATIESRQEALESLSVGLVKRSDDINKTMSSFGQMITAMVEDVAEKSKGIGGSVSAELTTAIDDATSRFSESVEAMREAAATIRQELDYTREQMRRGILELPDETQQSANAMRRVVSDQIAALRDLSQIVEKSGKMLDASTPGIAPDIPAAPRAPVAPVPAQRQTSAAAQFPPRTTTPDPARPADLNMALRGSVSPAATQAAATPVAPAPSAQDGGWVSDLLRRASEEEQRPAAPQPRTAQSNQRSPLHVVESLNSLSMDIASAIDHEASVDLWDRYQRGETNVFTRRLYTLQGRQTFDEIRTKYQREAEFRGAVDRYIEDFERLLNDVSKSDRDNIMTQTYLTSDTGKVYTMLAHASGRLGNA